MVQLHKCYENQQLLRLYKKCRKQNYFVHASYSHFTKFRRECQIPFFVCYFILGKILLTVCSFNYVCSPKSELHIYAYFDRGSRCNKNLSCCLKMTHINLSHLQPQWKEYNLQMKKCQLSAACHHYTRALRHGTLQLHAIRVDVMSSTNRMMCIVSPLKATLTIF